MKLAVKKDEGSIKGGGFHYMLLPRPISDAEAPIWHAMDWVIIEVEFNHAERLVAAAEAALGHQLEVAHLVDGPKNKRVT